MKKLLFTLVLFASILLSSCASDTVVVYRDYPGRSYYYYWDGPYYTYHYYRPHTYAYHGYHYAPHKPAPKPHGPTHQPYVQPKPTNVPKATVRPHTNDSGGSMSGSNGRR